MAKCEKIEQAPLPPPPAFRLELTAQEASMLRALIEGPTAGASNVSLIEITEALRKAGAAKGSHRIVRRGLGDWDSVLLVNEA